MKTSIQILILLSAFLFGTTTVSAQATYNVESDITWKSNGIQSFPTPCYNCTFNINNGVTLTIERDVTFQNVTFNGGKVVIIDKRMTLWTSDGKKNTFGNIDFQFKGTASLMGSAPITINSSQFTFYGSSYMIPQQALSINSSTLRFLGNSYFEATGTPVDLKNNSSIIAGDGSLTSKAFIKFNGPMLNVYDNSAVTLSNKNNYYFNWGAYTSITQNRTISTYNNNLNCGAGSNSCSAPVMYGPSLLGTTGFGVITILPVKLISFNVKLLSNGSRQLTWSTSEEIKTENFEIEKSSDGSKWEKTGIVNASGNSASARSYQYTDHSTATKVTYYRLRMVDIDGAYSFSPIKSVSKEETVSVSIFPNPSTDFIKVTSKKPEGKSLIQLVNQNGQVVKKGSVNGASATTLDVSDCAAGMYVIRVISGNGAAETYKVQVIK